jgi:hypothetical protein
MKKNGFSAEQLIGKLREAGVLLSQGATVEEVSRKNRGLRNRLILVEGGSMEGWG